jgi:hypothetical protein
MSDNQEPYFDYRNPENHIQRGVGYDPDAPASNTAWGWIAAAVFLVVILAVAFGVGHQPGESRTNTAFNSPTPPAVNRMAPPAFAPAPVAPMAPAPTTPGPEPTNR